MRAVDPATGTSKLRHKSLPRAFPTAEMGQYFRVSVGHARAKTRNSDMAQFDCAGQERGYACASAYLSNGGIAPVPCGGFSPKYAEIAVLRNP